MRRWICSRKDPGAKLLAGGHSLLPAMKLRVAAPSALIDISRIDWLRGITVQNSNHDLMIGALTTHATVASDPLVRNDCALLAQAASGIGDQMVRNRGTIGGSVAHADPAADYPTVLKCIGAQMVALGPRGTRAMSSETFFTDLFTTQLADDEVLTAVVVENYGAGTGGYYAKFAHPASGYAVVGAAALVTLDAGKATKVSLTVGGATPNPVRCSAAEAILTGSAPTAATIVAAAEAAAGAIKDPLSDGYAGGDYRVALVKAMVKRALTEAVARA